MGIEVVKKEDLQVFRMRLLRDIQVIISTQNARQPAQAVEGYRTKDVRKILGCSVVAFFL
jgi:hypothetical protein